MVWSMNFISEVDDICRCTRRTQSKPRFQRNITRCEEKWAKYTDAWIEVAQKTSKKLTRVPLRSFSISMSMRYKDFLAKITDLCRYEWSSISEEFSNALEWKSVDLAITLRPSSLAQGSKFRLRKLFTIWFSLSRQKLRLVTELNR